MQDVVEIALVVLAACLLSTGSIAWVVKRRLGRSNRLVPGRSSPVPWQWRWSLGKPAMLHRRLRRACQMVVAATGGPDAYRRRTKWWRRSSQDTSVLHTTGRLLLDQALSLEEQLVAVDRGGASWRRMHMARLSGEVRSVEAAALRLAQLSKALDEHIESSAGGETPQQPELLLDAMEAAIAELGRGASPAPPGGPALGRGPATGPAGGTATSR